MLFLSITLFDDFDMDFLAKNLTFLMEQKGLNDYDLSRITGIPQPSIYRISKGTTKSPSISRLKVLASFFDVTYNELIGQDLASNGVKPKTPSEKDFIIINYYSAKGACGMGELNEFVELRGGMAFPIVMLDMIGADSAHSAIIKASGDSMAPTICNNDLVLLDTSKTEAKEGRVFVINRAGNGTIIKRLKINEMGKWYYHSDNPDINRYGPMYPLDGDFIVGQVLWQGGSSRL